MPSEVLQPVDPAIIDSVTQYIEKCPDPETKFFPDGEGAYLSIIELKREMIQGTLLGHRVAKSWAGLQEDIKA